MLPHPTHHTHTHTAVDERLTGAKLIGVLSPFKRTQFASNGFNFLASQICPHFFFSWGFFLGLLFLEFRHFISLLCANIPALSAYYSSCDIDQSVSLWVHVCGSVCKCVCPERAEIGLPNCHLVLPLKIHMFMQTPAIPVSMYVLQWHQKDIHQNFFHLNLRIKKVVSGINDASDNVKSKIIFVHYIDAENQWKRMPTHVLKVYKWFVSILPGHSVVLFRSSGDY